MPKEVRVRRGNFEIVIPFENENELKEGIDGLPGVFKIIEENVGNLAEESREVKAGWEQIYEVNKDGSVSIIAPPGDKTENIGIILFAYDPTPLSIKDISLWSGVKNATDFIRGKNFERIGRGQCKLSSEGLKWISDVKKDMLKPLPEEGKTA
jgi:hypothetical protein